MLRRERDELDEAVAVPLREGRRVVAFLVGDEKMRPSVLAWLRERSEVAIPEPVALTEPDQTLDVLARINGGVPGEVWTLLVDHAAPNVLRTLNWHREKLRRGASVLLWIDGVDGLRALRALAPDAYAFRDVMIAIKGEEAAAVVPPETESMEVALARMRYAGARSPEERAETASDLADHLRLHGARTEAHPILSEALAAISSHASERARIARGRLYLGLRITTGGQAEAWRYGQQGVAELEGLASSKARDKRLFLLASMSSPLGVDYHSARRALAELQQNGESMFTHSQVLRGAAWSAMAHGDLPLAARLLREVLAISDLTVDNRSFTLLDQGYVELAAGRITRAEERYRASSALGESAGIGTSHSTLELAACNQLKGEFDVARRILGNVVAQPGEVNDDRVNARLRLVDIATAEGDVPRALTDLRALLHEAASSRNDRHLYATAAAYVPSLRDAYEADRLTPADLADAAVELDVAEDIALSIARDDPPWYAILFPGFRAELLAIHPDRLPDAIALAARTLDRARAVWPDAAPMHARMLVAHLLHAGRLDEARTALALAEPEAEAQRHLRELARLRAHTVAVLARSAAPTAEIDAAMVALRTTLDETGAPRIAGDTLLELGRLLPPSASHPDPLVLLDEAGELFADMPIPAQAARSLEAAGDVLSARGDAAARTRYLEAKGICQRYGFGLRLPLIVAKMAR
jgi:hypothetical protein